MSKPFRIVQGFLKWIRSHPFSAALSFVVAIVGGYGAFSGGLHAMRDDFNLIFSGEAAPKPDAVYALDLVNVYGDIKTVAPGVGPPGVKKVLSLGAIIANHNDSVSLTVARDHSSIGDVVTGKEAEQLKLSEAVDVIRPGRGIAVHVPVAYVPITDANKDMAGRIDWIIKFGPSEKEMTRELPVSGAIFHNMVGGKMLFSWSPDGASAKPSGMPSMTTRKDTP